MLKDRLKTATVLIAIVVALFYCDARFSPQGAGGVWLLPLLLFLSLGTASDFSLLLAQSGRLISRRATLVATSIVTLSACVPLLWPLIGSTYPPNCAVGTLGWLVVGSVTAVFVILLGEMSVYGKVPTPSQDALQEKPGTEKGERGHSGTIERTCAATFVSIYVGLPMALLVAIRSMGDGNWGLAALLTTVAVTKSTDTGAYFTGRLLGKHKLIPRLSPGKTKEGAIGGIVTATIVAFICLKWLFPVIAGESATSGITPAIPGLDNPLWGAILFGPSLAIAGMFGDLAESLVKRDCGAKDSGTSLPGMGGVWDVTDSLIAAVLPAFLCFAAGVGP